MSKNASPIQAVYLERGAGWSRSFVEPSKRERPKKPDEPDPRHAPQHVRLQDLDPFSGRGHVHSRRLADNRSLSDAEDPHAPCDDHLPRPA